MVSKYSRVVSRYDILASPLSNVRRPSETNKFSQILLPHQKAVSIQNYKTALYL